MHRQRMLVKRSQPPWSEVLVAKLQYSSAKLEFYCRHERISLSRTEISLKYDPELLKVLGRLCHLTPIALMNIFR